MFDYSVIVSKCLGKRGYAVVQYLHVLIGVPQHVYNLMKGAEKASYVANKTLRKVYKKVGFYQI